MKESVKLFYLVRRNLKCYFKDKTIFFLSLLTPIILIVLYATFLRNVYIDSFKSIFEIYEFKAGDRLVEGLAGAWLTSSLIGVSSVTVAFCSNIVMVQDKIDGSLTDLKVSPVKSTTVSISYFIADFAATILVMSCVLVIGFIYIAAVGWYITVGDAFMILLDTVLAALFGSLLSGVVLSFVKSQGATNAVSSLISSVYGFIAGAYMPLSQFGDGLRSVLSCLPGTYSVSILRNHFMDGYFKEFARLGMPTEGVNAIKYGFDANITIGGNYAEGQVVGGLHMPLWGMYLVVICACVLLFAALTAIIILNGKIKKLHVKKRAKSRL